jgi:hypothetical protein
MSKFFLYPFEKRLLVVKARVIEIGTIKTKFQSNIAEIPGFGHINQPNYFLYKGK